MKERWRWGDRQLGGRVKSNVTSNFSASSQSTSCLSYCLWSATVQPLFTSSRLLYLTGMSISVRWQIFDLTESVISHNSSGMWNWIAGKVVLYIAQRLLTSSLGSSSTRALSWTLEPEEEDITILRNFRNHSTNDTESYLKIFETGSNTAGRAVRNTALHCIQYVHTESHT